MILTTDEAAAELGVSAARVRQFVMAGMLQPVRRGASPMRFRLDDVIDLQQRRRSATDQARLDMLAEEWHNSPETC
jgi:excisionase family DNA binding protein